MVIFTTTLDLYGGVLWSGEFQGFIIHESVPSGVVFGKGNRRYKHTASLFRACSTTDLSAPAP
jgi:hypothetical protein